MNVRCNIGAASRRRLVLAGFGGMAAALAVASISWACTPIVGSTWFHDGSFTMTGPANTPVNVSVFATGARPNSQFELVTGTSTSAGHESHGCMDIPQRINPNVRFSNARGFIATTNGNVTRGPGEWQICFRQLPSGQSATYPVFLTLT